jgi:hypothetical protein
VPPLASRRDHRLVLLLLVVLAAVTYWIVSQSLQSPPEPPVEGFDQEALRCGAERWPVKTLSDGRAIAALRSDPQVANIQDLANRPRPPWYHEAERSREEEVQYVVDAWIIAYKLEPDNDIHVVVQDENGWHLVAEFPHPSCVARLSSREPLARARQELRALLPLEPHSSFTHGVRIPVRIRGVFFFDRPHGQTGHAPNGAELHPVLEVTRRD